MTSKPESKSSKPGAKRTPAANPVHSAARRRTRYGLQAAALLLAISAVVGFLGVLADRYPHRVDATASRQHQLSQRTTDLLARLNGPHELVIVTNLDGVEPRALSRTQDVLDNFARATPNLRVTAIDVASAKGPADLDSVLARLVERYEPELRAVRDGVASAVASVETIAAELDGIGESLTRISDLVPTDASNAAAVKRYLSDSAGLCRVAANDAKKDSAAAQITLNQTIGRSPVPALDLAASQIRKPVAGLQSQANQLARSLNSLSGLPETEVPLAVQDAISPLAKRATELRDSAAQLVAAIDLLPRVGITSAARVLERAGAALVIGPPRADGGPALAAVDVEALFPRRIPGVTDVGPQPDMRARAEELLAGALMAISTEKAPIVILTHGATEAERLTPEFAPLANLIGRLGMRGISVVEWAAGIDTDPPSIARVDPDGKRPVVFVTISTNAGTPDGAARMIKLSRAIQAVAQTGRPVLLSVAPSTLPAIGQKDPMVEFTENMFGLKIDSGRPLLRQMQTPSGPTVSADLFITQPNADHAVAQAIESLRTQLPWVTPIEIAEDALRAWPVIVINDDDRTWGESEWLRFRQTPAAQRPLLANPPQEDSARDNGKGPWVAVAAAERTLPDRKERQRFLVVGSNGWFLDDLTTQAMTGNAGRPVPIVPGNLELFEAAVYWLAGQDEMVVRSAEAQAMPTIPAMPAEKLQAIRWGLIAGAPLLVLLLGALWRLIRG
jgi:hypothetical protein